ncbi:conserved hypothetical protein [Neospora caninum Liverpool]|uniref:Transmembrane protein n=1 Tax=Neospora caninum (strain Liverpool) TaxID=572307 RepID=F0VRD2_NEOCL|nr:conserved hypothetical protein [Neospora caninum Liverpool]CBZ56280.1 conserved hypothetical protein [Neospora caninum Liverpool]CEL71043.1 TPA: hypothetical protein BN1204_067050 [Neospora caninum Liverpool]|eukprot:XP_003886305.1 conserved hypothetical protein [Neospora caninum Liverpool]
MGKPKSQVRDSSLGSGLGGSPASSVAHPTSPNGASEASKNPKHGGWSQRAEGETAEEKLGGCSGVQSRYPVMTEREHQVLRQLQVAELKRQGPSAVRSFVESLCLAVYVAFLPGFFNACLRRFPPFNAWEGGTTSALALWACLACWSALFARGNVTDPGGFLVGVREAKTWSREDRHLRVLAQQDLLGAAGARAASPIRRNADGDAETESADEALARVSVGVFCKITAASLLGATVVGLVLRFFFSEATFLSPLEPLPHQVYVDLPAPVPGKVSPPFFLPSSSLVASLLPLLPVALQLRTTEMLRSGLVLASRLFALLRRVGLGVCTAGIAMVLKPGGGHQQFQEQMIKSDFFKQFFGEVSDASRDSAHGFFGPSLPDNFFSKIVHTLTGSAAGVKEEEMAVLWVSGIVDMFLLEVFFGFLAYMAAAVQASVTAAAQGTRFQIRGISYASLNAACFFYYFGIPFCTPVGGPMLNAGYAALVTAYRLDVIGFFLLVSADLLAAYLATLVVRPFACVPEKKPAAPDKVDRNFSVWPEQREKRKAE